MPVFKCKMCGGRLEVNEGSSITVCEYCGSKQTLPKLDNEQRLNMYDRADHFRRNYEYDKAMSVYENIINEDNSDAEAYWSVVLCKYGVEYVEDPTSKKRIPTINRAQYISVLADEDFKAAIKHADSFQKELYEEEAKYIDKIQKVILEISQKEEPYDVFICYKDTDANGKRTRDSVLANDLYHGLTAEGFKVFFSRISLEDKLGSAYEPYIFAALNSAKAMVVLGTKPEYFNAVWVKNEWKRYLALIKSGAKKVLIPAYKEMDPYELPEEFSHLQAQDMSKLGFMQDIIRGIKKIVVTDEPKVIKETVIAVNESSDRANIQTLIKRMFSFLEDEDWEKATEYSDRVLDIEPECVDAYIGRLMSHVGIVTKSDFRLLSSKFTEAQVERLFTSPYYARILRYGDESTVAEFKGYEQKYFDDIAVAKNQGKYEEACNLMLSGITKRNIAEINSAKKIFKPLGQYKDSELRVEKCEYAIKELEYNDAIEVMNQEHKYSYSIKNAMCVFIELGDYKESKKMAEKCRIRYEELKAIEDIERASRNKRSKRVFITIASIIIVCVLISVALFTIIIPNNKYNQASEFVKQNDYLSAYRLYRELGDYKDSIEKHKEYQWKYSEVGDIFYFGNYEQDNDSSNGMETIEWIVLAKEGNRILVISKYSLDCMVYDDGKSGYMWTIAQWDISSVRKWLNNDFINTAFKDEQQTVIPSTNIDTDGIKTNDKVFLLSAEEAYKYLSSNDSLIAYPTEYAKEKGALRERGIVEKPTWWWLRSKSNYDNTFKAAVNATGGINEYGFRHSSGTIGVRPAMWIILDT